MAPWHVAIMVLLHELPIDEHHRGWVQGWRGSPLTGGAVLCIHSVAAHGDAWGICGVRGLVGSDSELTLEGPGETYIIRAVMVLDGVLLSCSTESATTSR